MTHYLAFDPNSEMSGLSVQSFVRNILHEDIAEILVRHGLNEIDPQKWYPVQKLLDVFSEVAAEGSNTSQVFVSVGMGAAELGYAAMPAQAKAKLTLEAFLSAYGNRLNELHRGNVGYIQYEKIADGHYVMTWKIPYPDDVMYGVFYGFTRLLRPSDKAFVLEYDRDQPSSDNGGEMTVLHIYVKD